MQQAPILAHAMEGLPYRLYTDASDSACGCTLQQIQKTKIRDLKGTKTYLLLKKAWEEEKLIQWLYAKINSKINDEEYCQQWGLDFEETEVWTEQVVAYYSRRFKGPETQYSAMEREALAAKEGLVRFQPFIEGEKITLITDHLALQWAKTYENSNCRLAAWGTVFSAYAPNLEIVHRPGRKHSNVDPLSHLPRSPPEHYSPIDQEDQSLKPKNDLAEAQEMALKGIPAWRVQAVWTLQDAFAVTRSRKESQSSSDAGEDKRQQKRQPHKRRKASEQIRPKKAQNMEIKKAFN